MQDIEARLREIQQGNQQVREDLLASHKEFIHKYASFICKKHLDWSNDDELSIALIAFNKAIDSYDCAAGKNFLGYARVLIKNSLVDYFRRQQKLQIYPLNNGTERAGLLASEEAAACRENYLQEIENRERAYEIQCFKETLASFGLSFHDLARNSPSHKDTRENLKKIAQAVAGKPELVKDVLAKKKLPIKQIQLLTQTSRKTLEKWRKYILSLIIILSYKEMVGLAEYIWGKEVCSWKQ